MGESIMSFRTITDESCDKIIDGALWVLELTGCKVLHAEAREMLAHAGCVVEGGYRENTSSTHAGSYFDSAKISRYYPI